MQTPLVVHCRKCSDETRGESDERKQTLCCNGPVEVEMLSVKIDSFEVYSILLAIILI